MPSIPRNKLAIGQKYKKKQGANLQNKKNINSYNDICTKHTIGEFESVTGAKLISHGGTVTNITYNRLVGNMQASILIFEGTDITPSDESMYDLMTIEANKKEKERLKAEKEEKEKEDHIKKMRDAEGKYDDEHRNAFTAEGEGVDSGKTHQEMLDSTHQEMLETLGVDSDQKNSQTEPQTESVQPEPADPDQFTPDELDQPASQTESAPITTSDSSKVVYLKGLDRPLLRVNLPKHIKGNSHHRNALKDLAAKFPLYQDIAYRYLEVKVNRTQMVIDKVGVFYLEVSSTDRYMLVIGDLQMKSSLIKQIDPNYGAEDALKGHTEFADQVRSQVEATDSTDPSMPELVETVPTPMSSVPTPFGSVELPGSGPGIIQSIPDAELSDSE